MIHETYVGKSKYYMHSTGEIYLEQFIKIPLVTKGMEHLGEFKEMLLPIRPVKFSINNRGYYNFKLNKKTKMVHRVLAEIFIPNPSNKPYVNHLNGNKLDNSIHNLEWCTHLENMTHARTTGLISEEGKLNSIKALKENTIFHKLPEHVVNTIRSRFKRRCLINGATVMAKEYGISRVTMSKILNFRHPYNQ